MGGVKNRNEGEKSPFPGSKVILPDFFYTFMHEAGIVKPGMQSSNVFLLLFKKPL